MAFDPNWGNAISSIESGGRYDALGPVTKSGDRAYGRYQVMGANIPQWTKKFLGVEMTPQQFVADPNAQEAVFRGQFTEYADKYGPEGAAKAWFAGPGGMNNPNAKDQLGTSVDAYAQKFMGGLGQQAPAFNAPPQQSAPLPAFAWSPQAQQQSEPAPQAAPQPVPQAQPPAFPWMGLPMRRPPDVSQLRALLENANAPASVRGLLF